MTTIVRGSVLERVSVKDFGAVGDGVTDDTAAIQLAIDHWKGLLFDDGDGYSENGATIVFPGDGARYRHDSSLDFTGIRVKGARVVFEGSALFSHCTGKVAVDMTHSRYMQWDNLQIIGDETSKPSIGLLQARSSTGLNSDNHIFNNLKILGHFSVAGLYNYASEVNSYYSGLIWNYANDTGSWDYVITRSNTLSVTSDYETVGTTEQSTNDNFWYGCDWRKFNDGHNVLIDGVRNLRAQGYCSYGGSFGSLRGYHILANTDSAERSTQIELDIHFESPSVVTTAIFEYQHTVNVNTIFGLEIKDFNPQATSYVTINGAQGVSNLRLEGFMGSTVKPFSSTTTGGNIRGAEIRNHSIVKDVGSIDLSDLTTFSGEIHTFSVDDLTPTLTPTNTRADIITSERATVYQGRQVGTITSGSLAGTSNYIQVIGEGSVSDDLEFITGTYMDGEEVTLVNVDAADVITVIHQNVLNGIITKTGANVTLNQFGTIKLRWVINVSRWIEV